MAESPDTVGLGNPPGHDNVNDFPARTNVTAGPLPPVENRTSATEATGRRVRPADRSDRSISAHEPSARRVRCGTTADSVVNPPDGFAKTCDNSDRADSTSTRRPDRFAATTADSASGATDGFGAAATGAAASAGDGATSKELTTTAAMPAARKRLSGKAGSIKRPVAISTPVKDFNQSRALYGTRCAPSTNAIR
ncbi:hypothetical protein [Micromonospora sp. CV4]|uniref:hypothetical protein n=1 Tax=Micromonospora sp. CV4 TaxID=2478711 RepID=UPI00131542C2|nr:hypothetical protein [Micromonospora sp. CV4]